MRTTKSSKRLTKSGKRLLSLENLAVESFETNANLSVLPDETVVTCWATECVSWRQVCPAC